MAMTEHEIRQLYYKASDAKMKFDMLAMRNTNGLSPDQRAQLDIDYHRAHAEHIDAYNTYLTAVRYNMRATPQSIEEPMGDDVEAAGSESQHDTKTPVPPRLRLQSSA